MAVLRLPLPPATLAKPGSVHPRIDCSGRLSGEGEERQRRDAGLPSIPHPSPPQSWPASLFHVRGPMLAGEM